MDVRAPNIIVNPEKFELVLHANEDCTFELTNVGYEAIIYRVRTTAPLRYYLKHSKGVVKGNSSAKITIFLNQKTFAEGLPVGVRYTKDTFRWNDVIEAHGANLANLIQKKKDANASSVVQKYISGSAGEKSSSGRKSMTAEQMEQNTLNEKRRRNVSGGQLAEIAE
ncbi:MSP (Major sperm protein) domain family protein [Leishmania donovani]|uniref:MSP (Major sperm protein) domain family protein n=1 Tax=Leishmania donovani TaxID=5661 RepID=A0A504X9P9_LEIDO|nr:MSP (Major sperm protein) domain family protein [Leishmania donovani]